MSRSMFTRASHAVEDALASDDNHPDDIARAVLLAVREPDEAVVAAGWDYGPRYDDLLDPGAIFFGMIDAILSETP